MLVENLSFSFSAKHPPLFEGITFRAHTPSLTFIQGRNGIGKSLLLRIIAGEIHPGERATGSITLHDTRYNLRDNTHMAHTYRQNVRMVPQKFDLMIADQFSFNENLELARLSAYPGIRKHKGELVIPPAIKNLAIDMHKPAHLLSGGQRQILAITMTLQRQTHVLLLDEPTAALDSQNSRMVIQFLHELTHTTDLIALIITHDHELIKEFPTSQQLKLHADEKTGARTLITEALSTHLPEGSRP